MRPRTLEVQAFRGWRTPAAIDVSAPITLIVGENRSGKSSTTNAIEWCLYGALVEKRSPGLEERARWEVRPRDAGDADTVVTLMLDDDGVGVEITRRRPAQAKARAPDRVTVRREGEAPLEGEAAERWIRDSGLPHWEDYRRAHCFHQEAARTRVIDLNDRSTVLAELLGLDEDLRVRDAIYQQTKASLVKEVDERLAALERTLLDRLANPRHELLAAEQGLTARGVSAAGIGPALLQEVRTRMVRRAREIAARLDLEVALPAPETGGAVLAWARDWPATLDGSSGAPKRLAALLARHGRIDAARGAAKPAQGAWRAARAGREEAQAQGGDEAARAARLREADAALKAADDALKRSHRLAALLRDARALIGTADGAADCPVCRTAVPALGTRVDEAIRGLESEEVGRLAAARTVAEGAFRVARQGLEQFQRLARDEENARRDHETKRQALAGHLGAEAPDADADLVAVATARLESIVEEGRVLRELETAQRDARQQHQDDLDLLLDLERWDRLRVAAERVVDLDALPSRHALDAAIDEAAAFASDVEALANLARDAQQERSARRESDVNESVGAYYALITGDASESVRVHVHRTPKGLSYHLVDAEGRPAVPVLNQAALNALSLAMLCAQAETRARAGGPDFVVLDDPVQSLDRTRQEGLGRAVERLAATCAVIVAVTPSHLVEHVCEAVGTARRVHHLAPWDPAQGTRLERTVRL